MKTYEIRYNHWLQGAYNVDFKGRGRLRIDPAGPVFIFEGTERRFRARGMKELRLTPDHTGEVLALPSGVQISTTLGESGRQNRNFIFFTRSFAEAEEIAASWPGGKTVRTPEAREFERQLAAASHSNSGWASVTGALVAANILCFAALVFVFGAPLTGSDGSFDAYRDFAANYGPRTADGEWWRLFTSLFSHYGMIHLLLNMWALFSAGKFLERLQGRACFALTYFGSGLAGDFASILFHIQPVWSAGASGAVFGVYGAVLGHFLHQKKSLPGALFRSILNSLLMFAVYNVAWGLMNPNIDQAAHVGGALGGLLFGWLLARPLEPAERQKLYFSRVVRGWIALTGIFASGMILITRMKF